MKTKTPKPRVMWAVYPLPYNKGDGISAHPYKADAEFYSWNDGRDGTVRVAVTPLDDIEALVERVALALINSARGKDGMAKVGQFYKFPKDSQDFYLNDARAALTAAGIPCKQRRRPGPRGGKLYLSTSQAITALKKEVLGNTEHLAIKEATP